MTAQMAVKQTVQITVDGDDIEAIGAYVNMTDALVDEGLSTEPEGNSPYQRLIGIRARYFDACRASDGSVTP